jgi:hypothetical protein
MSALLDHLGEPLVTLTITITAVIRREFIPLMFNGALELTPETGVLSFEISGEDQPANQEAGIQS